MTPEASVGLSRLTGLAAVALGKAMSLGALLVCGVVVARVAGPEEFALYSTALALALVLDGCLGSPLDYAAVRFTALYPGDPKRAAGFQGAAFRIKLAIGAVLIAVGAGFGRALAGVIFQDEKRAGLLLIAVASTLALLLMRSVAAYLQAHSRFRAYSTLDVAQAATRFALVALLAILGVVHAEWYLGAFGGASAGLFAGCLLLVRQAYLTARWPEAGDAAALLRFLGATAGVIVLGTITGRTDLLFLAAWEQSGALAQYAAAAQVASVATLAAGYASVVVQPNLIPMARRGDLPRLLVEGGLLAVILGAAGVAAAWHLGGPLMATVFGESFGPAGGLLRILVIGTSVDLLFMPVAMTFTLQLRPGAALAGEAAIAAVYLLAAAPTAALGASAMAWLATGVRMAKGTLYFGIMLHELRRHGLRSAEATGTVIDTGVALGQKP